jgi:hypothetical protein
LGATSEVIGDTEQEVQGLTVASGVGLGRGLGIGRRLARAPGLTEFGQGTSQCAFVTSTEFRANESCQRFGVASGFARVSARETARLREQLSNGFGRAAAVGA